MPWGILMNGKWEMRSLLKISSNLSSSFPWGIKNPLVRFGKGRGTADLSGILLAGTARPISCVGVCSRNALVQLLWTVPDVQVNAGEAGEAGWVWSFAGDSSIRLLLSGGVRWDDLLEAPWAPEIREKRLSIFCSKCAVLLFLVLAWGLSKCWL